MIQVSFPFEFIKKISDTYYLPRELASQLRCSAAVEYSFEDVPHSALMNGFKIVQPETGWRTDEALTKIIEEDKLGRLSDTSYNALREVNITFYSCDPTKKDLRIVYTHLILRIIDHGIEENRWIKPLVKMCQNYFDPHLV